MRSRQDRQRWRRGGVVNTGRRDRPIRTGRREQPIVHLPSVALRVAVVAGMALAVFAVILFRLWFLQILSGKAYLAEANDNRLRSVKVVAPRGAILDRNGKVLVDNRPGLAVGIRPMDIPRGERTAVVRRVARVLGMTPFQVRQKLSLHSTQPAYDLVVIKDDVSKTVVSYILEHQLSFPGVEVQKDYLRHYPQGDLAAHVLGYLGEIGPVQLKQKQYRGYQPGDIIGLSGVEKTYDNWLRGQDGQLKIEVDAMGRPKQQGKPVGGRLPQAGDNLVLSIESGVQKAAENAVAYGIQLAHNNSHWAADAGAAVVLDANTGEIVAMASYPTYNPNVWVGGISAKNFANLQKKSSNYPLIDRADEVGYAVGSTFKPIDAVAGLEEGMITPYTTFFCPGYYKNHGTTWHCWSPNGHGSVSLVTALAESCDVYFYNLGYRFYLRTDTALEDWATRLGIGHPTGIDIPGEVAGRVPTPKWRQSYFKTEIDKLWKPGNSINLAIGQGDLESNPLQMAVAYAAVANGGYIVTPHLGVKVVADDGSLVRRFDAPAPRKLDVSLADLKVVQQGLRDAASSNIGTSAAVFANYPIPVAGKTGTAQVFSKGDYAWYCSYAPANNPKYVVVVMIEQGGHGGTVAAPAARMIYDAIFDKHTGKVTGAIRSD